jgi:hypothetical protein
MIIHHSLNLLRHLSEIENVIQLWERAIDQNGVEFDRKKYLRELIAGQQRPTDDKENLE